MLNKTIIFLILTTCSIASADRHSFDRKVFSFSKQNSEKTRLLTAQTVKDALIELKDAEHAVLFVGTDCPAAQASAPIFDLVARIYGDSVVFARIPAVQYKPTFGSSSPTIYYVRSGNISDVMKGFFYPDSHSVRQLRMKQAIEGLVVRNRYGFDAAHDMMFLGSSAFISKLKLRHLQNIRLDKPLVKTNEDLEGLLVSGADLTGANFSGSNLTGAQFWNVDLTSANFAGTKVDAVIWRYTTCPDGFRVEEEGNCSEHLQTKPGPSLRIQVSPLQK